MPRTIFAHGLESSPGGTKAVYLKERFGTFSPRLYHLVLSFQVDALEEALARSERSILIGSSLGGLASLGVANRCPDRITHLVLLAPAVSCNRREDAFKDAEKSRPGIREEAIEMQKLSVPETIPTTIIHGIEDDVVLTEDVLSLGARSPSARLVFVHDDHPLSGSRNLILSTVGRAVTGADTLILS
ncbi:MAG: hypothetical protein GY854_00190 [Deltaproteobacteria bacterium]|nr:hypothetical protein [Deltaproteobacteria bacterium]